MVEQENLSYRPDAVSPPGDTLADLLEERGMSQAELAERTGRPLKTINEIIKGKTAITPETAIQLERVLGAPAEFWNHREANYRAYLASRREFENLESHRSWLKAFPVSEMRKRGWIEECETSVAAQMICILNFFGVASPAQWDAGWTKRRLAFRRAMNLSSEIGATAAWLRQGEIEGEQIQCKAFDREKLLESLPKIRALTLERDPQVFVPRLTEYCSDAGVAIVFVRPFQGVPVYGASCWLTPEKALIQLSIRGKTADILWFTVFHELAHVLKHSKKELFVEIDQAAIERSAEENEADGFAAETLLPADALQEWLAKTPRISAEAVTQFANDLGIAPGIIVGRLQHIRKIPYSSLNGLKFRYQWKDE